MLTLPELDARVRTFLVETYLQRPHGETGVPPQMRWEANGFLPRLPESLEQLDLLLLTVAKPRRVHPDGIDFQGFRYLDITLAAYVGEDVNIRHDPRDMAELRVCVGDSFLWRAIEFLARTGLRKGELLDLTVNAVVQIGWAYRLHVPVGKLRSGRYIPLHPQLKELLDAWLAARPTLRSNYLFIEHAHRATPRRPCGRPGRRHGRHRARHAAPASPHTGP